MEFHPDPASASASASAPRPNTSPAATGSSFAPASSLDMAATATTLNTRPITGQMPLPTTSFSGLPTQPATQKSTATQGPSRGNSHRSVHSAGSRADVEGHSEGDHDGSANETDADAGRPSKKKKGQRFFCTDFPPCTLSFTRSEHLARHIRKHTGERPFQCHCSRRFSRLDNLRQHAQTVHQHEEIPNDSLAASGTRFQRQIRTDRVRTAGQRTRASTIAGTGTHSRGHSRNLSASSITSTVSNLSRADDARRRPPPLIMANEAAQRVRLPFEDVAPNPTTPPGQFSVLSVPVQSPAQFAGASASTGLPAHTLASNYASTISSPVSTISRNNSIPAAYWGTRTPARRSSVPTAANPFLAPQPTNTYVPPNLAPPPHSMSVLTPNGNNKSVLYASPTSNIPSNHEVASPTDIELRRRTWHPCTYSTFSRPATSGLSYSQTPDNAQLSFTPSASVANQQTRLPGIESFDYPQTPPRREPSPMQVDLPCRFADQSHVGLASESRRGHASHVSWDSSLYNNLNRLEIGGTPPTESSAAWGRQVIGELHNAAVRASAPIQAFAYQQQQITPLDNRPLSREAQAIPQQPTTPREQKRHAWYHGPLQKTPQQQQANMSMRRSPEDSSSSDGVPTPSTAATEYYPAIVHSNGYVEPQHVATAETIQDIRTQQPQRYEYYQASVEEKSRPLDGQRFPRYNDVASRTFGPELPQVSNGMGRLEALVAVATSEERAAF